MWKGKGNLENHAEECKATMESQRQHSKLAYPRRIMSKWYTLHTSRLDAKRLRRGLDLLQAQSTTSSLITQVTRQYLVFVEHNADESPLPPLDEVLRPRGD